MTRGARVTRIWWVLAVTTLLIGTTAVPAVAAGKGESPAHICKANDNTWIIPDETGHPFPFTIQSDGGCASSVAQGFDGTFENWNLSMSAFNSQCKWLEAVGAVEYPYAFYGNPDWMAKNRADCMKILHFFHNEL